MHIQLVHWAWSNHMKSKQKISIYKVINNAHNDHRSAVSVINDEENENTSLWAGIV